MNAASSITLIVLLLFAGLMGIGYLYAERSQLTEEIEQLRRENHLLQAAVQTAKATHQRELAQAQAVIQAEEERNANLVRQLAVLQQALVDTQALAQASCRTEGQILAKRQAAGTLSRSPSVLLQSAIPANVITTSTRILVAFVIAAAVVLLGLLCKAI